MKTQFSKIILIILLIVCRHNVHAQSSCSSGYSLINLYTGYGKDYTVNNSAYVTNGVNAVGIADGSYATVTHNATVANRGVLTIDLSDNVPNLDTIYFVASSQDANAATWNVSVSSDGTNFSSVTGFSQSTGVLSTFSCIVSNASGARYIRFASTSATKDLRVDAVFYNLKTCKSYCRSADFTYVGGNASANFSGSTATNPSRALGAPNPSAGSYTLINGSSSQVLNLDLGTVVPYGAYIQLFLANNVSGTNAVFQVTGSATTTSFTSAQSFTSRSTRNTYTDFYYNVTQSTGVRYLKIIVTNAVAGVVDAVTYQYPDYWGNNYISGTLFSDPNINAVKDGMESGASGITVTLSKDFNNNGAFNPGDTVIYTTTTTTGGAYEFQVPTLDTNYIISVLASTLPAGNQFTGTNLKTAHISTFNNSNCGNDFGYYTCTGNCPPVAVDDNVNGTVGSASYINVAYNDYDPNNNLNTNSVQIILQPHKGQVVLNAGIPIYTPSATGLDTFTYKIADLTSPTPLWDTAMVVISVSAIGIDACVDASLSHLYYLPAPEQDLRTAFDRADCPSPPTALSDSMRTIVSIKCPYPGIVIYYDQWEDGYESSILNPAQTTTQVWGDGDLYNGVAPGYSDDIIPGGGSIILDNTMFDNPRNSAQIYYDARDKLFSTEEIALSRISWDVARTTVQAYSVDVYDLSRFGTSFNIPVGNYTGATKDFQYSSLFVRAASNNTSISIDADNNGTVDVTRTLNEGESYFQNGGVNAGASVTSSLPVGVDVFFGDSVSCYNAKELNVLPAAFYGDTYYSPVPTTKSPDSAVVMFYNFLSQSITINWNTSATSGSFNIGAKGVYRFQLGPNGYKFKSANGESYVANELIDAWTVDGTTSTASDYDWAFALIPENRLTSFGAIAWAPGSIDGSANGNPVWVMPNAATTIYVKWDGNITGTSGSTSPCGLKYDVSYALANLQVQKLLDAADKDQSGLAVYDCSDVKLAMAYGEDPSLSSSGPPYIDAGTSIQPFCVEKIVFANDDYAFTAINTPVTIQVLKNDTGFTAIIDPATVTNNGFLQPRHGIVSVNANGTLLYTPATGYTGQDTMQYYVCSTPTQVCDMATVIVKISACPAPAKKNLISGQVFWDRSKDGINNDGGLGIAGCKVYLYTDGNCNSTIDANELTDSVTVDASGYYQFIPNAQKITADDFNDANGNRTCANGTDGNTAWLTDWTDAGDASSVGFCNNGASVANTDVEIVKDALGVGLRLKDKNRSATRTLNLSGATSAYLSFAYRRKSTTFISTDSVKVQMSTNGTAWTTIYTITGNAAVDAAYINVVNQSILSYASATTYLRFSTGSNTSTTDADSVYIDNVSIKYIKYPQCYITKLAAVPAGYNATTATQFASSASSAATCLTGYDFGLAKNSVTISGTLYNDANGLSDGLVNGTAIDAPSGVTLYAYLADSTGKILFKDTLNNGNGTYSFTKADVNTTYSVVISSSNLSVLSNAPEANLPGKWVSVGDVYGTNNNAGTGVSTGIPNSSITVITGVSSVTGVTFGIQLPNAGPDKSTCENYGTNTVTMAASTTPGTWTAQYDNPGTATITSSTSTTTTITNFSTGGTYNFIWTNAVGGTDTARVVVTEPQAGVNFSVCGGSIGTLTGNYSSGTWTAKSGNPAGATLGSTSNGIANVNFNNTATGTYLYIYTVSGCSDTVNLSVTPKPVAGSASSTLNTCANTQGYVAQLTATNPSPNTGAWYISSGPGNILTPANYISTIGSLSKTGVSTTAKWVITDSYGCHDTASTTMTPAVLDTSLISKYSTSFCITCPVINGNKFDYFDLNGKLLASVTDSNDAVSIGQTNFCAKLNYPVSGDPLVSNVQTLDTYIDGAGHVPQPYLPRAWTVNTTTDAQMTIHLYFTDKEVSALQGATMNHGNYYYFDTAPKLLIAAYPNNSDTFIPAGAPGGLVIRPSFARVSGYWKISFRMARSATFYLYPTFWQGSPLPVELINFDATALDKSIRLDWSTASEENNLKFEIERSADAVNFEKIGEVAGAGNSTGIRYYTFEDVNVVPGLVYYYRLRQVDINGHETESKIRKAMISGILENINIGQFILNTADRSAKIIVMSPYTALINVKVYTIDGKKVTESSYPVNEGQNEIRMDMNQLSKGTYVVQFNSVQGTEVRKLIRIE